MARQIRRLRFGARRWRLFFEILMGSAVAKAMAGQARLGNGSRLRCALARQDGAARRLIGKGQDTSRGGETGPAESELIQVNPT